MQVTYKENIPRKVVLMKDLYNIKAVEHNDLINSVAKMDKVPLKIFELAVSCLDIENPPKDNTVAISKKTLFTFFSVEDQSKHTRFKHALTNLHQQSIFEIKEINEDGNLSFKIISPISSSEWNDYDDDVKIKFTNDIMPYLVDLKRNFTQYLITDIMELNSKYSIILYKWISMNYNQFESYKENGKRREEQLEQLKNPYITMKEFRRMTDTLNEYSRFQNFESRVLKVATDEITKYTNYNITYEKIKKGRSIGGIQFYIDKKVSVAKLPYKENSEKAKEDIEKKEKDNKEIYLNSLGNKYTEELKKNNIINTNNMIDETFMVKLVKDVYPLYEDMEQLRDFGIVIKHISYVKDKMIDYEDNKKNIIKYLTVSAEDYIRYVKISEI